MPKGLSGFFYYYQGSCYLIGRKGVMKMSSGFYAELIEEITELIAQGRFEEARTKVDTELAMP